MNKTLIKMLCVFMAITATFTRPSFAAEESLPAMLHPLSLTGRPGMMFGKQLHVSGHPCIVMLGSSNAEQSRHYGYLETLLALAHPDQRIQFRNLAWQADTVHQQQRPLNFFGTNKPSYGDADGRKRLKADVAILWIGRSEALDGPAQLDTFSRKYDTIVQALMQLAVQVVLVTPEPFEDPLGLGLNLAERNQHLALYAERIREAARRYHSGIVDLHKALQVREDKSPLTTDGILLSAQGHWQVAQVFVQELGLASRLQFMPTQLRGDGSFHQAGIEVVRQAALHNARLWDAYWRPTNWAFLYGDRQSQPSSRSHLDSANRWFPVEIEAILPRLEQGDASIQSAAKQVLGIK